jgi:circadian clock protein KaiC
MSQRLDALVESGSAGVINTRTLDLSLDEVLHDLIEMIIRMKAKRVVIDSLSGFEMALASVFREDFRESLYRLVASLTQLGVTVLMTAETEDRYTDLRFSTYGNAFLADAILMQRYIELHGRLRRVLSVVKVRASAHSDHLHFYDIHDGDIHVGDTLEHYEGILTGQPRLHGRG